MCVKAERTMVSAALAARSCGRGFVVFGDGDGDGDGGGGGGSGVVWEGEGVWERDGSVPSDRWRWKMERRIIG